jgi:hypothetical protein
MMLTDMLFASVGKIFRSPAPVLTTAERKFLTVPLHHAVDTPRMQAVLAKAAEEIATSGLVWK